MQISTRHFFLYTFVIFLLLCGAQVFVAYRVEYSAVAARRQELADNELRVVKVNRSALTSRLHRLSSDVFFLRDLFEINGGARCDQNITEREWISFVYRKKVYDQIRFIGIDGNEKIRVRNGNDGPESVAESEFKNRSSRNYFTHAVKMSRDELYISKLDLNSENGKIDVPYKPVIRFAAPCFNNAGACDGIIVLNYGAKDILLSLKTVFDASRGSTYLVNGDGYWLYNSDEQSKAWSFMFPQQIQYRMKDDFPNEWKKISRGGEGTFISPNGLFSYTDLQNEASSEIADKYTKYTYGEQNWYIVSRIAPSGKNAEIVSWSNMQIAGHVMKGSVPLFFVMLIASLSAAYVIIRNNKRRERIQFLSEYDAMTGAYNRRAGMDKMNSLRHGKNSQSVISLCFADVNGLKAVNDTFGHEAGDELLKIVVDSIRQNIRPTDYFIRMGGDEFLVVFENASVDAAEAVWSRITKAIDEQNDTNKRNYIVSVSHGICEWKTNESMESAVKEADTRMYEEKKVLKEKVQIIKNK